MYYNLGQSSIEVRFQRHSFVAQTQWLKQASSTVDVQLWTEFVLQACVPYLLQSALFHVLKRVIACWALAH